MYLLAYPVQICLEWSSLLAKEELIHENAHTYLIQDGSKFGFTRRGDLPRWICILQVKLYSNLGRFAF